MSKSKKTAARSAKKVPEAEKEQVRARRQLGHTFALTTDDRGRDRLRDGTAESQRQYEISNGGIVRLRNIDPLIGIQSLSEPQRRAGIQYRTDYEMATREGIRTGAMAEHVDGGYAGGAGVPTKVLDALLSLDLARKSVRHPKLILVLDQVCGLQRSISDTSKQTGQPRDVLVDRLRIGLDLISDYYGTGRRRRAG